MESRMQAAKILVVDDQQANVDLIEGMLESSGFSKLQLITDSRQAIPFVKAFQPDIILLDLSMPFIDGFEIMHELKGIIDPMDFLPILVLTADVTHDAKRKAFAEGANDYLTKPLERFDVIHRTRNLLRIRFLTQEINDRRTKTHSMPASATA